MADYYKCIKSCLYEATCKILVFSPSLLERNVIALRVGVNSILSMGVKASSAKKARDKGPRSSSPSEGSPT